MNKVKFDKRVYGVFNEDTNELVGPRVLSYPCVVRSIYEHKRGANMGTKHLDFSGKFKTVLIKNVEIEFLDDTSSHVIKDEFPMPQIGQKVYVLVNNSLIVRKTVEFLGKTHFLHTSTMKNISMMNMAKIGDSKRRIYIYE